MTDARSKFEEAGAKLKNSLPEKEVAVVESVRELSIPEGLSSFFKDNAAVGTDNLGGDGAFFPYLKVTEANSNNELSDGKRSTSGMFYYAPTKEQFGEVLVNIVNISRGFYLKNEPKEPTTDPKKLRKFVQLVGGVMVANQQPFVMIVSGTRLNNLWNFGKGIKLYTKSKNPVPMFALKVELSTEEIKTDYGFNHVVNYALNTNEAGVPNIVQDRGNLEFLKEVADKMGKQFIEYEQRFAIDPVTLRPLYNSSEPVPVEGDLAVGIEDQKMPWEEGK